MKLHLAPSSIDIREKGNLSGTGRRVDVGAVPLDALVDGSVHAHLAHDVLDHVPRVDAFFGLSADDVLVGVGTLNQSVPVRKTCDISMPDWVEIAPTAP